jgi:hypothetical protein
MSAALTDRLEPVQAALAELEHEYYKLANVDHEPGLWALWGHLAGALMEVRAAQGRAAGHRPPVETEAE